MSTLKISRHSDVPTALDLVKEEVEKESKRIFSAGGDALKVGNIKPAKEAIAYAEKLSDFVKKIQRLGEEWKKLEARIDAATPEVREIVLPTKPQKGHKTGYTRNVETIAQKTGFKVTFADGTVVSAPKAKTVLAKTIEKIGVERVAALGILCGGEPLVTRDKRLYVKMPTQVAEIPGGWFVKTHSSTAAKAGYVKTMAKALGVKLAVKTVPGTFAVAKEKKTSQPTSDAKNNDSVFPYAVGKVVQAVFPALQSDRRMTVESVAMLKADASSARFKTGGWAVLKPNTGNAEEIKDAHGIKRYYGKLPLCFLGKKYWLTSQFQPHGIEPVLAWLEELGLSKDEILEICNRRWTSRQGLLFEDVK